MRGCVDTQKQFGRANLSLALRAANHAKKELLPRIALNEVWRDECTQANEAALMNILEVLSVHIPRGPSGEFYEVPLNDILLSHQMLEQGCPVQDETECPPLFQTRIIGRDILDDFVKAWSRLDASVRQNGGEVVIRDSNRKARRRDSGRKDATLNITDGERDRGLDETLCETFPCSDALSSIPDP